MDNDGVAANNLGWSNRSYCEALEDLRRSLNKLEILTGSVVGDSQDLEVILKTIFVLNTLVEEVQIYGNRMEAGLSDKNTMKTLKEDYKELKARKDELKKEIQELEKPKNHRDPLRWGRESSELPTRTIRQDPLSVYPFDPR